MSPQHLQLASGDLDGLRILIVEDEPLLVMAVESTLFDFGCDVIVATKLPKALMLAATETLDGAILDINLGHGTTSYPVALALKARSIPFIFCTGYRVRTLPPDLQNTPLLSKPYDEAALAPLLRKIFVRTRRQEGNPD